MHTNYLPDVATFVSLLAALGSGSERLWCGCEEELPVKMVSAGLAGLEGGLVPEFGSELAS